jgi:hypothetical protein
MHYALICSSAIARHYEHVARSLYLRRLLSFGIEDMRNNVAEPDPYYGEME